MFIFLPPIFTASALPVITDFAPRSGAIGDTITVYGTGLTGATQLTINGTPVTGLTVGVGGTSATGVIAVGTTVGTVSVTTPAGTAVSAVDFVVGAGGGTNYTDEQAVDAVGVALIAGNSTNTGVEAIYAATQDAGDRINLQLKSTPGTLYYAHPTTGLLLPLTIGAGLSIVNGALVAGGGGGGGGGDFSSVVILLPFDASNGSTTFTNVSSYGGTVAPSGVVSHTSGEKKWGSAAADFGGGFLSLPSLPQANVGLGDFTIEVWLRLTTSPSNQLAVYNPVTGANGLFVSATRTPGFWLDGTGAILSSTVPLQLNTWTYVAVVRSGTTLSMRQGESGFATQVASTSNVSSWDFQSWRLGQGNFRNPWTGQMDDFRLSSRAQDVSLVPTAPFPTS